MTTDPAARDWRRNELITAWEIADLRGYTTAHPRPEDRRKVLGLVASWIRQTRHSTGVVIPMVARQPGGAGMGMYPRELVQEAHRLSPGKGHRRKYAPGERPRRRRTIPPCRTPGCEFKTRRRGLCRACLRAAGETP